MSLKLGQHLQMQAKHASSNDRHKQSYSELQLSQAVPGEREQTRAISGLRFKNLPTLHAISPRPRTTTRNEADTMATDTRGVGWKGVVYVWTV
jgi:hypothetical protein